MWLSLFFLELLLSSSTFLRCQAKVRYKLPWFHPEIERVAKDMITFSGTHPRLDDDASFQAFIGENTGESHDFFDGEWGFIQDPWRLPGGHPNIDDYFYFEDIPVNLFPVLFFDHPDIQDVFLSGAQIPKSHPSVSNLLRNILPNDHPDVHDLFVSNSTRNLPEWHINLSSLLTLRSMPKVTVFWGHPSPQQMYNMNVPLPKSHPSVSAMLNSFLPPSHGDVDEMLSSPLDFPLPDFHPNLERFLYQNRTLSSPLVPVIDYITLYFDHPDIRKAYSNEEKVPEGHPSINDLLKDVIPKNHMDIGELFSNHPKLPIYHPEITHILHIEQMERVSVFPEHPQLDKMYESLERIPRSHPSVTQLLQAYLPPMHPENLDLMLRNPESHPLPDFHPSLSSFLSFDSISQENIVSTDNDTISSENSIITSIFKSSLSQTPTFSVFSGHPDLTIEYDIGDPVDDHPSVHYMFEPFLPDGHPDIDDTMRKGFILPSYHPDISSFLKPRSLVYSPASNLCYFMGFLLIVILLCRSIRKLQKRTIEIPPPPEDFSFKSLFATEVMSNGESDHSSNKDTVEIEDDLGDELVEVKCAFEGGLPSLNQRNYNALEKHKNHRDNYFSQKHECVRENIIAYKEKRNTTLRLSFMKLFGKRLFKSYVSTGEAMICLLYLFINLASLIISPTYAYDIGFGSLSAGNILFLVIAATRNSVLTWVIGITFDQALVYHRFIGRLTVIFSLIHSIMHYDHMIHRSSEKLTVTGLTALACGLLIFMSSLNYFRRKWFNIFFWSHFSFIGFIAGTYIHASGARPFILASILCYSLDKLLQMVWTQCPRKTILFSSCDHRTAHVRFKKTPLMNLLGKYKVGQYVFVNFPELSLTEWHPFSVASDPNDPCVDLYIRALGNHTKRIVQFSEHCAAKNKQAMIRCDGPYGDLNFNYRRFGNLLLVGGGIGITPIISLLKDIYGNCPTKPNKPTQCIRIVTLVWIMPHVSEASLFLDLFNQFHCKSLENPIYPALHLSIYVTRDKEQNTDHQIKYSKPDFETVMNECIANMSEGSRSILVYVCGPGRMVNQLWDASIKKNNKNVRVDFYHESFEF